jgi:hypothetical protein
MDFRPSGAKVGGSEHRGRCGLPSRLKRRRAMGMWLYDDAREMDDFQTYQKEVRQLEGEYLEIRILLRDAEGELRSDPDSEYLQAKVKYLRKRLKHLESQAPRLAADHPLEISLWAPPHG